MKPEHQEAVIQRRVSTNIAIALDKLQFRRWRYVSKDYKAYLDRVRARYVPTFNIEALHRPATERFAALGQALADHLMDDICRPGFMRMLLAPDDPSVVAYHWQQAQIKGRTEAILETVLKYDRRGYYADKGYVKAVEFTPEGLKSAIRKGARIIVASSLAQRLIANRGRGVHPFDIQFDILSTDPLGVPEHLSTVGYLYGAQVIVNQFYEPDRFIVQDLAGPAQFTTFEFTLKE